MRTNAIYPRLPADTRSKARALALLLRHHAWRWTGFLAFAAIALGLPSAQAAVTEAWVQRYSNIASSTTDRAIKVVRDGAGDIIVTGSIAGGFPGADMLTIKYSGRNGSVLWRQRAHGPGNSADRPTGLAVDGSSNVVVAGVVAALGENYAYTAKYAAGDGALLWEKRHWSDLTTVALAVDGSGNVVVTGSSDSSLFYNTAKFAAANGALLWERRQDPPNGGGATAVAVDGSGNVVVTGWASGANSINHYTAKYAEADGALLWEKRHKGPAEASALALDASGNVVVTGSSFYLSGEEGYFTAKYAGDDGALLWEQPNGSGHAIAVAVDGSGNVVVAGNSGNSSTGSMDFSTAKYAAADGARLWEQRYNGPANLWDYANAVLVDGSNNVVVTGCTDCRHFFGLIVGDYYTAMYAAADGVLLWERRYNGPTNSADIANAVAVDARGNVLVTGQSWNGTNDDYYTAKYAAADGALLWEQRYDGLAPNDASAREVAVDGSGNVAVTGSAYVNGPDGSPSGSDYYTAKYAAADGALLWEKRYNGSTNSYDQASSVAVDLSGNVVVTGSSEPGSYTAKYAAADGALLWEKKGDGFGSAIAVAVDALGNVVVTGTSNHAPPCDGGLRTAKYAAANGALLWEKCYRGPANRSELPQALAIDISGNVVVTAASFFWGGPADYYTARYAAADGALLWEQRYTNGYPTAVAVDGNGNVVVTGYSWDVSKADYLTVKYAAADGALLWEKRYNGPANGYDEARAVAVDGSGNVVVTGRSFDVNFTKSDYYTAKYAATDGALLWEKRYNSPADGQDQARAVAVDGSGNVVVTGNSFLLNYLRSDYYTAKYAAADGALLWETRFKGSGGVGDSAHCLALGPDGMVAITGSSNGAYGTVVYRDVPAVSIELISAGVRLRVTGLPGRRYKIERNPAVTGPWNTLNTQIAPASGAFEYLDTNPRAGAAFYRASEQ